MRTASHVQPNFCPATKSFRLLDIADTQRHPRSQKGSRIGSIVFHKLGTDHSTRSQGVQTASSYTNTITHTSSSSATNTCRTWARVSTLVLRSPRDSKVGQRHTPSKGLHRPRSSTQGEMFRAVGVSSLLCSPSQADEEVERVCESSCSPSSIRRRNSRTTKNESSRTTVTSTVTRWML